MRKLRVVGSSSDHTELILSNKPRGKQGSHSVAIDKKLLEVLSDAVYSLRDLERKERNARAPVVPPRAEPKFPPREIQRQLRAGSSPTQVAKAANVDEAYVEQFYTPVLYERAGVIQDVRAMFQEKPRLGRSGAPLGEAVAANLATRRVQLSDDALERAWLATRREGQPWTVTLTFSFRGRARAARWRFDPRDRTLTPANKLATDLGWVSNGRRRTTKTPEVAAASGRVSKRSGTLKKSAPRKRTPARKPAARKRTPARKPAARKRTPARKPATRKRTPARKPATRKRTPARKPATRRPAARKKASAKRPTRKAATRRPARARSRR